MRWLLVCLLPLFAAAKTKPQQVSHYEYVFPDGQMAVYDIDNGFRLIKSVSLPTSSGTRGAVACAATHTVFVSYGSDSTGPGHLLAYDLVNDKLLWTRSYSHGIDSHSISPDCQMIYMPDGELATNGTWYVETATTGADVGTVIGPKSPHNTVISSGGTRVYLGGRHSTTIAAASTATDAIVLQVPNLANSVRPFTINGKETLAFVSVTNFLGFQVLDLVNRKVLFTVPIQGFTWKCCTPSDPSHGISISPDERELYVIDYPNDYVHVFDISGLPAVVPKEVSNIKLIHSLHHYESPCAYDCLADGWLHHSFDGRYVFVGDSGDVISTATRQIIGYIPAMYQSRKMIEVDWQNGISVRAMYNRSSTGQVF